mgnify:CR=1 FL=1|jgi:hypothetical protein
MKRIKRRAFPVSHKGYKTNLMLPLLLILPLITIYCGGSGVVGNYYSPGDPADILEINKDGTFYCKEDGMGFSGTWQVKDDKLRLILTSGITAEARIVGEQIVDNEGKIWLKKK